MRHIFIGSEERSGILNLSLTAHPSRLLCSVDVPHEEIHLVLEKFEEIFESESIHRHDEEQEVRSLFSKVLGIEFVTALIRIATSELVTFTIQGNEVAFRLPWEILGHASPIGLQPNVRFSRAFNTETKYKPIQGNRISLCLFAAGKSTSSSMLYYADRELDAVAKIFESNSQFRIQCHHNVDRCQFENALHSGPVDIFHYAGHGEKRQSGGVLLFNGSALYSEDIYPVLDRANVSLAVLTGCWTAGFPTAVGHRLCKMGTPFVVAMQGPISDSGADLFARTFYFSLAHGHSIEESMQDGRQSLKGSGREWLVPTLYRLGKSEPWTINPIRKVTVKHNFPGARGRFIGREGELARLTSALMRKNCRLLTVTGMGGMGKTTIAHEIGRAQSSSMEHGARLIECEALENEADLLAAVVDALEIDLIVSKLEDLTEYLRDLEILLVFDCFERIVKSATFLSTLVRGCPKLRILVTSRILLGLDEEFEFPLEPLSTKKRKGLPSEAVELFLDRAPIRHVEELSTKKNLALVAALVDDLECIPLAIVLAAGRLRHLALQELQMRVRSNRLEIVSRTGEAKELKHGDMLRVVRDSLNLLEENEQQLLSILSIFARGFFIDDAEKIIGGATSPGTIGTLRENSLLSSEVIDGRMRYRMLDTVRECLDATPMGIDLQPYRLRHAEYYADRASRLRDYPVHKAGEVFRIEAANFRQAIVTSVKSQARVLVQTFIQTLARTLAEMGHREEFALLVSFSDSFFREDFSIMIQLRGLQGVLARRDGDPIRAAKFWQERASFCRQSTDESERLADSLLDLTDLALEQKEVDKVQTLLREFEMIPKESLSKEIQGSGLVLHAHFHIATKNFEKSLQYARRAELFLSQEEATQGHLYNQMRVGQIYRSSGDFEKGVSLVKQTVRQAIDTTHYHSAGISLLELADIFLEREHLELSAKGLIAGGRIPKDVSMSLREKFRKKTAEFKKLGYEDILVQVDKSLPKVDWREIALEISKAD